MLTYFRDYFSKLTEKQLVFFWLIFCFCALTYKLGGVPPYHSDENFYVESSRNMVESGDYLTPIYNDKKRFAKPILYYWLVSASYKIFGVNLVSARMTSALFGSLAVGLLYLVSRRLFEKRIALYSILILPATFLHFQISRWATTDIVMNFFVLLAFYFFVRLYQSDFKEITNTYLFYLVMALGFMVKGPPAIIIPGVVVGVFLLVSKQIKFLPQLLIGRGAMIILLVNLPWFLTMYFLHGDEFSNHIIGAEIEARLVHSAPFSFYYFGVLFRYYLPWSLFFLAAIFIQFGIYSHSFSSTPGVWAYFRLVPQSIKIHLKLLFVKENESVLLCYVWILVCLILFTLIRTEHSRYMLPASPAVAILVAKFFVDMESKEGLNWLGYKIPVALTCFILFLAAFLSGVMLCLSDLIYQVPMQSLILPAVFLAGGMGVFQFNKKRQCGRLVFAISFCLIVTFSLLSGEILPHASRYPMKSFSERILSSKFSGPIAVYRLGNNRAKLGVLTGKRVVILYTPDQLKQFLATDAQVMVVMREERLRQAFHGLPLKVVAEDDIWSDGRFDWERLKGLWGKATSDNYSKLTEKIYLLTNK